MIKINLFKTEKQFNLYIYHDQINQFLSRKEIYYRHPKLNFYNFISLPTRIFFPKLCFYKYKFDTGELYQLFEQISKT